MATEYADQFMSIDAEACLCDLCSIAGKQTLADYIYVSEEISIEGPALGDPDYWESADDTPKGLCEMHYHSIAPDRRLDFVAVPLTL